MAAEGRGAGTDWGIRADICERIETYRSSAKRERQRIAVCTSIIAGYDTLIVPHQLDSKVAYVCFTDGAPEPYGVWDCRPAPRHYPDPRRTSRYVKTHLTELLPDYDYAIWIDANVLIRGDIRKYAEAVERRALALGLVPHPLRDCVYEEARACKALKQCPDEVIDRQVERYRRAGMPPHAGLFAMSFHVSDLRHPLTEAFYRLWWHEIEAYSSRDQLSVGWALRESRVPYGLILQRGSGLDNHEDFWRFPHEQTRAFVIPEFLAKAALDWRR